MRTLHLFQFGKGNIGGALIDQVTRQHEVLADHYGIRLEYIGVCDRDRAVISPNGLNRSLAGDRAVERVLATHPASRPYQDDLTLLDEVLRMDIPDLCIVDVTAARLTPVHLTCLRRGIPVVTANKKPVAEDFDVYEELQRLGRRQTMTYWYETTAGAGLPVISTLRELVVTGDRVLEISGYLSGTLGYICSQLDTGQRFSDIVDDAKTCGYTEPDPRDDLNGMDIARKALILAREIGYTLNLSDVRVESMISEDLAQAETVDLFMARLSMENAAYALRIDESRQRGHVLRYIAQVKDGQCNVGLRSIPKDSPAGSLTGPDNLIVIHTTRYSESPLVIRGPGAGPYVTATGLFGDLVKAASVNNIK